MLAKIGDFLFELNGTNVDKIKRSLSFGFATNQRLGNHNSFQAVGMWEESVEFNGTLVVKSQNQLRDFETMGKLKKEATLALGTGEVMKVVILDISRELDSFLKSGEFLKQTYKIGLQRVSENDAS